MGFAEKGAEAGRRLAEPHAKKPVFVFVVALTTLACGWWSKSASAGAKDAADFLYWLGVILLVFGHVHAAWQGALLLLPLGALAGFVQVAVYSWLQRRIPPQMLGRSMALFMFIVMGLAPLASAAAGAALRVLDVTQLFTAAALCLLAVVAVGAAFTPLRRIAYVEAVAAR